MVEFNIGRHDYKFSCPDTSPYSELLPPQTGTPHCSRLFVPIRLKAASHFQKSNVAFLVALLPFLKMMLLFLMSSLRDLLLRITLPSIWLAKMITSVDLTSRFLFDALPSQLHNHSPSAYADIIISESALAELPVHGLPAASRSPRRSSPSSIFWETEVESCKSSCQWFSFAHVVRSFCHEASFLNQ